MSFWSNRGNSYRGHSRRYYGNRRGSSHRQSGGWNRDRTDNEGFEPERSRQGNEEGDFQQRASHRPPRGLRGREIGMWYARHSRGRKEAAEKKSV